MSRQDVINHLQDPEIQEKVKKIKFADDLNDIDEASYDIVWDLWNDCRAVFGCAWPYTGMDKFFEDLQKSN